MTRAHILRARRSPAFPLSVPAGFLILLLAGGAGAHDMALDVHWAADGALEGQLTYSDARAAEGNYVRVTASGDREFATIALQTDALGQFRLPLQQDIAYEIKVSGEEGHQITTSIGPRDQASASDTTTGGLPIYVMLGAALLLSLPLARRLQRPDSIAGRAHH
jgi:hypothetical protein